MPPPAGPIPTGTKPRRPHHRTRRDTAGQHQQAERARGDFPRPPFALAASLRGLPKKTRLAQERDPVKREVFQFETAQIHSERLVFLDESGFNLAMRRAYGWSARGAPLEEAIPFQRGVNFSVLGALDLQGMVATSQKAGSIERVDLEAFRKEDLSPKLEPGAVLVMDNAASHHGNAASHHGGQIDRIVQDAGCSVLCLPPHSPDFSPIELARAWIKRFVRRIAPRDDASRLAAIQSAIESLPAEFGESWSGKAGVQY